MVHAYRVRAVSGGIFLERTLVVGFDLVLGIGVEKLGRLGHGPDQAGASGEKLLAFASLKHLDTSLERGDGRESLLQEQCALAWKKTHHFGD